MATQQETMRNLLNLLESVDQRVSQDQLQSLDQALSEERCDLDEANLKGLVAGAAAVVALMAPNLSHALNSSEVKLASATATCSAVLDAYAMAKGMTPSIQAKMVNLSNGLAKITVDGINKGKSQGDANGVGTIQDAYTTSLNNSRKMVQAGDLTTINQVALQCIKWGQDVVKSY